MNNGMSLHRAMKEAGYAKTTLRQGFKFKKSPIVKNMMLGMAGKLKDKGLNTDFLADKFMEWMNAKKTVSGKFGEITNPDYDTQIKAYDRAKEIINPAQEGKGIKRKLEITEFVMDGEDKEGI